jgi:hypothetical protein
VAPDPSSAIFVIDLQDAIKKLFCFLSFFCILLFEGDRILLNLKNKSQDQPDVTGEYLVAKLTLVLRPHTSTQRIAKKVHPFSAT